MENISTKNCTFIYEPKGQALEYAELATNPYKGCGHGCAYCYVPNITRQKRSDFDSIAIERPSFKHGITKDIKKYSQTGDERQVMLSFTSDPYHPFDTSATRFAIEKIRNETSLGFCTLTKGGTRALRDIDLFRSNKDSFASTLTSLDDSFSKKWERGAALPKDRLLALESFFNKGIFTWVSLEPTLDVFASEEIIKESYQFVDLFKIGRANYLPMTKTTDWESYTLKMIDICTKLNVKHYIKKDLQKYLPEGYNNPLRVKQYHG